MPFWHCDSWCRGATPGPALTVLMFGTVFTLVRPLAAGALFAGFIAGQLVIFSGFLMRDSNRGSQKRNKNGE
jgi:hypothetical protein